MKFKLLPMFIFCTMCNISHAQKLSTKKIQKKLYELNDKINYDFYKESYLQKRIAFDYIKDTLIIHKYNWTAKKWKGELEIDTTIEFRSYHIPLKKIHNVSPNLSIKSINNEKVIDFIQYTHPEDVEFNRKKENTEYYANRFTDFDLSIMLRANSPVSYISVSFCCAMKEKAVINEISEFINKMINSVK